MLPDDAGARPGGRSGPLAGDVALVTGAGRGIGSAVARKLAGAGARVVVADLDREPAEAVVAEIETAGGEAVSLVGDVTAPDFGERAVERALFAFSELTIVVNNAGYVWNASIAKTSDEQWQAMLDVHATAPFRVLRAAGAHFREAAARERAAGGALRLRRVVNVSSISGLYGAATQAAYAAAKSALLGLTRTAAKEWGRHGVVVNCVAFGFIDTRLTQRVRGAEFPTVRIGARDHTVGIEEGRAEELRALIPLGRVGTPEEAAGAVYLLCLPEASYVSGQILVCAGGLLV